MSERYEPSSEFLQAIIADDMPLSGGEFGDANLRRLIQMTRDQESANRDWATFLLAQADIDTKAVRDALLQAAKDDLGVIRGEAILGLASRNSNLALPLVQAALSADTVVISILEAAALCAHPSLVEGLRRWTKPSRHSQADERATDALKACEGQASPATVKAIQDST